MSLSSLSESGSVELCKFSTNYGEKKRVMKVTEEIEAPESEVGHRRLRSSIYNKTLHASNKTIKFIKLKRNVIKYKPSGHTELREKEREIERQKTGWERVTETRKSQNNKCNKPSKLHCREKETESDRSAWKIRKT